jgi:hypothetical protein
MAGMSSERWVIRRECYQHKNEGDWYIAPGGYGCPKEERAVFHSYGDAVKFFNGYVMVPNAWRIVKLRVKPNPKKALLEAAVRFRDSDDSSNQIALNDAARTYAYSVLVGDK